VFVFAVTLLLATETLNNGGIPRSYSYNSLAGPVG